MKKIVSICLLTMMLAGMMPACGGGKAVTSGNGAVAKVVVNIEGMVTG